MIPAAIARKFASLHRVYLHFQTDNKSCTLYWPVITTYLLLCRKRIWHQRNFDTSSLLKRASWTDGLLGYWGNLDKPITAYLLGTSADEKR